MSDYEGTSTGHVPTPEMQPDLDDILQVEDVETHLVPVKISEPVETRELPSKRISLRTVPVSATAGTQILSDDPRRKHARIIAKDQDITLGATQAQAQLNGAWAPKLQYLPLNCVSEVWAMGVGGITDVSVIEEYWA